MSSVADEYLKEDIRNILNNGQKDENPRPKYEDGTPAYTYFVTHNVRTYDLSKGEFPITTLRPIAWKSAIKEVLAIYQNQSNKISEFERMGCKWWHPWMLDDGTIGKSYPYNLESHRPNEMKKTVKKIYRRHINEEFKKKRAVSVCDNVPSIDGKLYLNRYKIIGINDAMTDSKHTYYNIQFVDNNYITTMRKDIIGKSKGANPFDRTVYGVGYLDLYKQVENFTETEINVLKDKWENMFRRCYSESYLKDHPTYKDTFVHSDWHSFKNFLNDVRNIPQYFLAREEEFKGWDLDKDYYGSNAYSKDTCVFLKHNENSLYAQTGGCYKITDTETGTIYFEINLTEFSRMISARQPCLYSAFKKNHKYKNFVFEFIPNSTDYVYRYELSRNQLVELLKDIKQDPYGRRHIISFWNWSNIDKKALVECAYETIWTVRGQYLDMFLNQRSGDMLVASGAGNVNEVQYAALLMMVARDTGYEPGKFTHMVVNEQIYNRHIENAITLLNRQNDSDKVPTMKLNEKKTSFYDFTIEDFELHDYEPVKPNLRFDLGV